MTHAGLTLTNSLAECFAQWLSGRLFVHYYPRKPPMDVNQPKLAPFSSALVGAEYRRRGES